LREWPRGRYQKAVTFYYIVEWVGGKSNGRGLWNVFSTQGVWILISKILTLRDAERLIDL